MISRPARSAALILAVAVTAAAICGRLGLWQLSRLGERRAANARLLERLGEPVVRIDSLPTDTGDGHYRMARARGAMWYDRELAWAARVHQGSPGVNFLTPMRFAGTDTVLLVDRGWAYSPDARSTEFARWREADTLAVTGYVETWAHDCGVVAGNPLPRACADSASRVLRRLDRSAAERLVGAPVAPYLLMQTSDSALRADSVPVRAATPVLGEGPHFSYAFQWFAFAVVSIAGGIALARRTMAVPRRGTAQPGAGGGRA
jgi:surfeit locus 1 family protein